MHRAHLAPVGVQFLGDQRRQARERPLPELDVLRQDGHRVVGADLDEDVHRGARAAGLDAMESPMTSPAPLRKARRVVFTW